jgi:hypothetical protein
LGGLRQGAVRRAQASIALFVALHPPNRSRASAVITYQAASWTKPRRVVAKVEWHPGELVPRVGFIVTNMSRPAERVVAFYNKPASSGSKRVRAAADRGTTAAAATSAGVRLPDGHAFKNNR